MKCSAGCSDCCRARLSITRVEAILLRRGLARLPESEQRELKRRAQDADNEMCPALDGDGLCQLYEWRPLICRSFGVPLRHRSEVVLVNPPVIDVCDLNFKEVPLPSLPDEDVLEQTEMVSELAAINSDYCERNGLPAEERIGIAQILAATDLED